MPLFNPAIISIFESITEPFVFLDREMRYVFANQAARNLLGKSSEALLGNYVWDVFPNEPDSLFRAEIDRAAATGEATHVMGLNPNRGIWFDCYNYPSEHGLAILFRDVTEQKRVEQANENAERQLALLAEASQVFGSSIEYEETIRHVSELLVPRLADWCAVDLIDEDGTLRRVNVAHVDPERARLLQAQVASFPPNPDRPMGSAQIAASGKSVVIPHVTDEVLVENSVNQEQLELLRSIGITSVIGVPLKRRDVVLGVLLMAWAHPGKSYSETDLRFAEDLASRAAGAIEKARLYRDARLAAERLQAFNDTLERSVQDRTERLARAVKLLEARNRELQDFAYVASHDLQEPLRKISTFADLVVEEYGSVVGEEGRYYMDRMQDASRRMARLITDLLSYSRVSSRAQPFQPLDLNVILSQVKADIDLSVREADGRVEVGALPLIEADPTQMQQLFQNLIMNALKFRKPDESPVVEVVNLNGESDVENPLQVEACTIEVRDNGIGFEERHADRIFLPFKRLNDKGTFPGTGVGLAICKRIVDRHGGVISAHSEPGKGSAFRVTLPVRQTT